MGIGVHFGVSGKESTYPIIAGEGGAGAVRHPGIYLLASKPQLDIKQTCTQEKHRGLREPQVLVGHMLV